MIYLFQSGDTSRYAFSLDKTGCNMPPDDCGWLLRGALKPEDIPEDLAPAVNSIRRFSALSVLRGRSCP
jgi:hypothetical protein